MKRYLILTYFLVLSFCAGAQNLVPNPGFELYKGEEVNNWQHPDTPFYHHIIEPAEAHSGDAYYILCFSNGILLNEQVGIQLEEKLKVGKKYIIRFNYKYEKSDGVINEIQCGFLPQKADIIDSAYLAKNPIDVLRFKLDINELKKSLWNTAELEYTAKGNESYFMVGYFKNFNANKKTKDWLKPIPGKTEKENYEERNRKIAQEQFENTFGLIPFRARFQFDDFCIAEKNGNNFDCTSFLKAKFSLNNLLFESKSAALSPGPSAKIDSVIKVLGKSYWKKIVVTGYTDNTGSDETNTYLSTERAKSVYNYLIAHGIDKKRMKFAGMGKANPLASNETEEGRKKNRRVEIIVE